MTIFALRSLFLLFACLFFGLFFLSQFPYVFISVCSKVKFNWEKSIHITEVDRPMNTNINSDFVHITIFYGWSNVNIKFISNKLLNKINTTLYITFTYNTTLKTYTQTYIAKEIHTKKIVLFIAIMYILYKDCSQKNIIWKTDTCICV